MGEGRRDGRGRARPPNILARNLPCVQLQTVDLARQ